MENDKVTVDLEEYISLRQQSEELDNILKLIFESTRLLSGDELFNNPSTKLMDYIKLIRSRKYDMRVDELKEKNKKEEQ